MTVSHEKSRTNIYLDIHLKEQAKEIYKQYGLSLSQAVNMFLAQSVFNRGLPFDVKIPNEETLEAMKDVETGNNYEETIVDEAELLNRVNDIKNNTLKPLSRKEVFDGIC